MQFRIHKKFELNGTSFKNDEALLLFSKTISVAVFSFLSDFLDDSKIISLQTSGSTGIPKIIEVRKEFMMNSAKATGTFFDLPEGTTALLCMNLNFIAGKMMLIRALVLGWKLDVVAPNSSPLKSIKKNYDFCAMVPIQAYKSFNDLHKIKKLIIGGGAISRELEGALQNVSTQVFVTYGMTETVTHIAVKVLSLRGGTTWQSQNYQALPNVSISTDKRNCLIIDAPKIASERIITNDVVELVSDTEFKWLGRYDNIINSGGIKLIPEQIEEKLSSIIKLRFFVAGILDIVLGEKLVLIIEGKQTDVILSEAKNLSKYEIPKEIFFLDTFIETSTKKIQRKETLKLL